MTNPLAPVALNGATLAAFTVETPGANYGRVTVTREPGTPPFVVRQDGAFVRAHDRSVDAMAHAMSIAGWLVEILDNFQMEDSPR